MDLFERAASELLRAIRGNRSQIAFARRLGYRGNPITDWENGRRFPTTSEALRVAHVARLPVQASFAHFARIAPPSFENDFKTHEWLESLRGSITIATVAERSERSRYAVARWLSGKAEPRLPDFLRVVDAITQRVHDWVHELVGIEVVPTLRAAFEKVERARKLAFETPWSEAVLRVLETEGYQSAASPTQDYVGQRLGLEARVVESLLARLSQAMIVTWDGKKYRVIDGLNVDTSADPERLKGLRQHWARVGLERLENAEHPDWFAYNVLTVSKADSERIEQRLRAAYREIRAIVAESQPGEVAAALTMHLVRW